VSDKVNLLKQNEAMELLNSVKDLVANQLMNRANFYVTKRFMARETAPVSDFDLRFFMEVMEELFNDQEALRRILNGEDLRVWTDEEIP
jgi:hypothetical protein